MPCGAQPFFWILLASVAPAELSMLVNISLTPAAHQWIRALLEHSAVAKFMMENSWSLNEVNYKDAKAHLHMCFEAIRVEFLDEEPETRSLF